MPNKSPTHLHITAAVTGWHQIESFAAEQKPMLRRFDMIAYTGTPMILAGWNAPVVVDLAGLTISSKARPILKDHNPAFIVGHTDKLAVNEHTLQVTGTISGAGTIAHEVVAAADNGFPWQASIGASVQKAQFIPAHKTSTVNGQEHTGPLYIARQATLGEVSFVALGADDNSTATITASQQETPSMDFDTWLSDLGFIPDELSDEQRSSLQDIFDAENKEKSDDDDEGDEQSKEKDGHVPPEKDPVQAMRTDVAAEHERVTAIRRLCGPQHDTIAARAIIKGWDTTRTELEILRADRPQAPAAHINTNTDDTAAVLEAACLLSAKITTPEQHSHERHLDAAAKRFRGGIGLQELLLEAAWANGYSGRNFRDSRAVLAHAFGTGVQAGFSPVELSGILSNVANKYLLDGFTSVEQVWRDISAIRSVTDFKTVSSYRMTGAQQYELVAPGGEIKHGSLGEEQYHNKADTHALMLAIDRRDIINDDLGAITQVPRLLGRGSGLKINDVFWSVFLQQTNFFTAENKNLLTGVNTALGIDGLTAAETAFMEQVDGDGKPIGAIPSIMLVPPALSAMASQLHSSLELRGGTGSGKYPVANPHQGKFRTVVSRYLSNSHYAGHSTNAWYLLADPRDLPVVETAFLGGQEAPVIETADADFNQLGIQMRGYHDFGCALQDPRGGVKATGQA